MQTHPDPLAVSAAERHGVVIDATTGPERSNTFDCEPVVNCTELIGVKSPSFQTETAGFGNVGAADRTANVIGAPRREVSFGTAAGEAGKPDRAFATGQEPDDCGRVGYSGAGRVAFAPPVDGGAHHSNSEAEVMHRSAATLRRIDHAMSHRRQDEERGSLADFTASWAERGAADIAARMAAAQAEAAAARLARRPAELTAAERAHRAVRAAELDAERAARTLGDARFYLGYINRNLSGLSAIGRRNMRSNAFRGLNIARRHLRTAERILATARAALDAQRIADELTIPFLMAAE